MKSETLELEVEAASEVVHQVKGIEAGFSPPSQSISFISSASPSIRALARLGATLCMQERYPESLRALTEALAQSPDDAAILNDLAVVYERLEQTDQAIQIVERSLALSRAQNDSWIFLGNLKSKQGDLAGAQAAYESVLAVDPASPLAWQGLGFINIRQRKHHEAIECFIHYIRHGQATAPMLSILGKLFYESGQFIKSRDFFAAAVEFDAQHPLYRQMGRETSFICAAVKGDSLVDALRVYLQDCAKWPGKDDKNSDKLLGTTFALLNAHGHKDAAKRVGAIRVDLSPDSASAAYLLQAVSDDSTVTRSPDAYIIECFDEFADRFDDHLVNTLGYDIPRKLVAALADFVPAGAAVDALDVGCGTGLCGPLMRSFSSALTGVDLSPRMLDRARERQVYDRLACDEATSFLMHSPAGFDAIIAADVMIYFGDLAPLARAIATSLKPGGLLAFSTESTSALGYQLLSSGRFAQNNDYVRAVFGEEFILCAAHETTVRLEATQQVPGQLFVFRRRE